MVKVMNKPRASLQSMDSTQLDRQMTSTRSLASKMNRIIKITRTKMAN
jgi:hypothetical protein